MASHTGPEGQAVIVAMRVLSVVDAGAAAAPWPRFTAVSVEPRAFESATWPAELRVCPAESVLDASAMGQMVVDTTRVSVVRYVVLARAGQLVAAPGHAVMVAVRVLKIVEVVYSSSSWAEPPALWLLGARLVGGVWPEPEAVGMVASSMRVTGQIVVDATIVSVVRKVVLELAGQSVTEPGQAVTVVVRVLKMVDVVNPCPLADVSL